MANTYLIAFGNGDFFVAYLAYLILTYITYLFCINQTTWSRFDSVRDELNKTRSVTFLFILPP